MPEELPHIQKDLKAMLTHLKPIFKPKNVNMQHPNDGFYPSETHLQPKNAQKKAHKHTCI